MPISAGALEASGFTRDGSAPADEVDNVVANDAILAATRAKLSSH